MTPRIIHSADIVALLGASTVSAPALAAVLAPGRLLVAVDGGAMSAMAAGHIPDWVVGDFDSLTVQARAALPPERLLHVPEQETTDFDKALRHVAAPLVLAAGFTGGRLDHELAVYNALVRQPDRRAIVVGDEDIAFHCPDALALDLPPGTRVSLFPMAEVRCASTGLRWPTGHLVFHPAGRIGTSNVAEGPVTLAPSRPGLLVILPRMHLAAAIAALRTVPAR